MEYAHIGDKNTFQQAVEAFRNHQVVVFPTDTVYGVGCCISSARALPRIFKLKNRPVEKPLPILLASFEQASSLACLPDNQQALIDLWPGPYTFILKTEKQLNPYLCRNNKIALRVPDFPFLRSVITALGEGIAGTSANVSGEQPAGALSDLPSSFLEKVDLVIDGGKINGQPSFVYDYSGSRPRVIRKQTENKDENCTCQ